MPKVRASSATMGTHSGPTCLSRSTMFSACTKLMVVEFSRSPVLLSRRSNASSFGASSFLLVVRRRCGRKPPSFSRRERMYSTSGDFSPGW